MLQVRYISEMGFFDGLSKNHVYTVVSELDTQYVLNNDLGGTSTIQKDKFELIESENPNELHWDVEYDDEGFHAFEWIEKHRSASMCLDLLCYKENHLNENNGHKFSVECFGVWKAKLDNIVPSGCEIGKNMQFTYFRTHTLEHALQVIEEIKTYVNMQLMTS